MTVTSTSLAAYSSLSPLSINESQERVLNAVNFLAAASDQDIAEWLGWPINRVTPRRGELVKLGRVKKVGTKKGLTSRLCWTWSIA